MSKSKDMQLIWEAYSQRSCINEITDSKRNREALIAAYGLRDDRQAGELIKQWNKYEKLIDPTQEYGFARSVKNLNPRDIFAWSRSERFMNDGQPDPNSARANLLSMIEMLKQVSRQREIQKHEQDNYETVMSKNGVTVYIPRTEGASCKLGAGTKWCTAATKSQNMFDKYTKQDGVTLYYIHTKHDGKYAVAVYPNTSKREIYDEEDNMMNSRDLREILSDYDVTMEDFLPEIDPGAALLSLAEQVEREYLNGDGSQSETVYDMLNQARELDPELLQQIRKQSMQPDQALLRYRGISSPGHDQDHLVSNHAISWFTNSKFNPPGTMKATNWQFQEQFELTISEMFDLIDKGVHKKTIQNMGDDLPPEQGRLEDLRYNLGNNPDMHKRISNYVKNHMNGPWKELQLLTYDLLLTDPAYFASNNHTIWMMHFLIDQNQGRDEKLEHELLRQLQIAANNKFGYKMPEAYDDQVEDFFNSWHDLFRVNAMYNRAVASYQGAASESDMVAYLPTVRHVLEVLRWKIK